MAHTMVRYVICILAQKATPRSTTKCAARLISCFANFRLRPYTSIYGTRHVNTLRQKTINRGLVIAMPNLGLLSWRHAIEPAEFPAILCRNLDKLEERYPFFVYDTPVDQNAVIDWLYAAWKAGHTNKRFAASAAKTIRTTCPRASPP